MWDLRRCLLLRLSLCFARYELSESPQARFAFHIQEVPFDELRLGCEQELGACKNIVDETCVIGAAFGAISGILLMCCCMLMILNCPVRLFWRTFRRGLCNFGFKFSATTSMQFCVSGPPYELSCTGEVVGHAVCG